MKKMKWIVLALLTLCLLGSAALAEEAPVWSYDSGNACLRLAGEISGEVTIPAEVDGYPVNAIAGNAFYGQSGITSLTMPDSLRAIQDGAISGMDGLTQVTLNDGLEYIGGNFSSCNALTSVTVPASVRIVDAAFSNCENLKEIHFEGACPMFINAEWCFFMMPEDYVIYVPDDQLDAYAAALKDANGAADRLQPSGRSAILPEEVRSEDWFEFDASTGTITGYREYYAYVEIPETIGGVPVKAIGDSAMASDYSIFALILPEGLEEIGNGAFSRDSSLVYVKLPSTLKTIGDDAFFNAQIDQIDWSEGLETIGARAFQYDKAAILSLPETVKTIGESAFEGAWCQELYLGGNVTSIGSRAFAGTALNYLAFDLYAPIDIAPDAFAETQVTDLDLPWDCSFENRDAYAELLKDQCPDCTVWINNPDSAGVAECPVNEPEITTIEDGVWTVYNGSQADLTVWAAYDDINVTALGDGLFKGSQTIRSFYPHHCGWFTTIGAEAFADSSVETVELFGSITEIGDEAFRNCTNITELTLPESLTTIGSGAFKGCTGLTGLALPESLTGIGSGAFEGCDGITELTLPASLTRVDSGALDGCEHLAKLTVLCDPAILPEDLLANCPALTEVYAAPEATQQQVQALSAMVNRPWYDPVPRVGEPQSRFAAMPDAPLPGDDFWYDEEYSRLDAYQGYELNLILPREIDGVPLTMIGGTMMTRASYGDNFDVELPVVSLVIPENYTEIPAYAFSNCDTLETVICYAPIEHLADGMFSGCTNLREVVFVNGVRSLGNRVFSGCLSLETVYLGACVESVSESAFLDDDGDESYPYEDCITDPAQLPDVDALLAAVKCAPMPTPEPTATPAPARPVGAEGEPFLGTWSGVSMEIEGTEYSLTEFGMVMELTFSADGTVTLFDGEETDAAAWYVEDGAAIVDDMPAVLQPDGTLAMEEDGAKLIFARTDGAAQPEPDDLPGADLPEHPAAEDRLERKYVCVSAEVEGFAMDADMLGAEYSLTFHADGTMDFVIAGTALPGMTWTQGVAQTESGEADAYLVDYYGNQMEAILTEEGFDLNYFDSMLMHFIPEA